MAATYPDVALSLDVALAQAVADHLEDITAWTDLEPADGAVCLYLFHDQVPAGAQALIGAPMLAGAQIASDTRQWAGRISLSVYVPVPIEDDITRATEAAQCHAVAAAIRDAYLLHRLTPETIIRSAELVKFERGEMSGYVASDDPEVGGTTTTYAAYQAEIILTVTSLGL